MLNVLLKCNFFEFENDSFVRMLPVDLYCLVVVMRGFFCFVLFL